MKNLLLSLLAAALLCGTAHAQQVQSLDEIVAIVDEDVILKSELDRAMGALAESTIPPDRRWIPKGMEVAYTAKATTDITCIAETDPGQWTGEVGEGYDLPVRVRGVRTDGTVVVQGEIRLWLTAKR